MGRQAQFLNSLATITAQQAQVRAPTLRQLLQQPQHPLLGSTLIRRPLRGGMLIQMQEATTMGGPAASWW